jgi:hypothetical protein
MDFIFYTKTGGTIKTNESGLKSIYQNKDLAKVEFFHKGCKISFLLDNCKFIYVKKDGVVYVGKHKHVWKMKKKILARLDDDGIFLEGL